LETSDPIPGSGASKSEAAGNQRTRTTVFDPSTVISLAPAGKAATVVLPPGQRTRIPVGVCGVPSTWTALSSDQ
jgi:hypothetical protein